MAYAQACRFISTSVVVIGVICFGVKSHTQSDDGTISEELTAEYLEIALQKKNRILEEYRVLLEVYYEYKKASRTPKLFANPTYDPDLAAQLPPSVAKRFSKPSVSSVPEFSKALYNEFKNKMDSDPRLVGNSYVEFFRSYGGSGADNDVLQRFRKMYEPELPGLTDELSNAFSNRAGYALQGSVMYEAREIFATVSKANGYPRNRAPDYLPRLRQFRAELKGLSQSLKKRSPPCPVLFQNLGKRRT